LWTEKPKPGNVYQTDEQLYTETEVAELIKIARREALLNASDVHIGHEPEFKRFKNNSDIWSAYLRRRALEQD